MGEVYAFSGIAGHAEFITKFYAPSAGMVPAAARVCHLRHQNVIAGKFLARQPPPIQNLVQSNALTQAFRPPGLENPADGFAKLKYDSMPLPGALRPSRGVASHEPSRRTSVES